MFARKNSIALFPTKVWTLALSEREARLVNQAVMTIIARERAEPGGWRGRRGLEDLHTRPQLLPLSRKIEAAAREIVEELEVDSESFRISRCWAEIEPRWQSANGRRLEPHHFLSGVYAVQTPSHSAVVFHDPRMQTNGTDIRYKAVTDINATSAIIGLESGSLILFPSWLPRSLHNEHAERECITLGFDVAVRPKTRSGGSRSS